MADPIRILQHRKQKLLNKKESLSDNRWKYEYAKRVKEIDCLIENFFNREWSDGDFDTGEKQCFIPVVVGSLPTEEERDSEKNRVRDIILKEIPDLDRVSFGAGFRACYAWFTKRCTK